MLNYNTLLIILSYPTLFHPLESCMLLLLESRIEYFIPIFEWNFVWLEKSFYIPVKLLKTQLQCLKDYWDSLLITFWILFPLYFWNCLICLNSRNCWTHFIFFFFFKIIRNLELWWRNLEKTPQRKNWEVRNFKLNSFLFQFPIFRTFYYNLYLKLVV